LWVLFGVLYLMEGYYAFSTPVTTAVVLSSLLSISLIIGGVIRSINAFLVRPIAGWGCTLFSGLLTLTTGIFILVSIVSPFWVLGMFFGVDILF
ncbi:DUF308 domain-containing protein, partial [Acinetobacter baumannii]|uniref:DUF308 domain-containing protein n=1 Tax=Acinetobacter baumannii TaxID=470 RepID=UPI0009A99263